MKKILKWFLHFITRKSLSLFESISLALVIVLVDNPFLIVAGSILVVVLQIILEHLIQEEIEND